MINSKYSILGIMSGTSLDGVDITFCDYILTNNQWKFKCHHGKTYPYPVEISENLKNATKLSAIDLSILDKEIGRYFATFVNDFMKEYSLDLFKIDAISSHGHTIFHQPENGFTLQIGCGTTLSVLTKLPVINDFRTKDVVLGGQGAPLVPVGDFQLFSNHADGFLNIGGISNISFFEKDKITAYDICPGNIPLNLLMNELGKDYDEDGKESSKGNLSVELFEQLNQLSFYQQKGPKSLGMEWMNNVFLPIVTNYSLSQQDKLHTISEHIAFQIATIANQQNIKKILITGGGAFNTYLISRIKHFFDGEVYLPTNQIISFKEAIVFGFLGALYFEKQSNCLKDVTGASRNSCSGVLHLPN